jgi:hypothetical protein
MLRRDLASVRDLAARIAGGSTAAEVRSELAGLQTHSLLFQLRANCLGYCQIVHAHHGGEDAVLFPAVRRSAPHLNETVDRLQADHRAVSALLDRVQSLTKELDDRPARHALVLALTRLSTDLLQHLEYEEQSRFRTRAGADYGCRCIGRRDDVVGRYRAQRACRSARHRHALIRRVLRGRFQRCRPMR